MSSDAPLVIEGPGPRRLRRVRKLFWFFAAAVFTATHWPKLKIPGPENSDKVLHLTAFGTWMVLCTASGWFGRPLSSRNIALSMVTSLVYAAIDEGLQGFKFIGRTCSWADYTANVAGITLAALLLFASRPLLRPRADRPEPPR